MSYQVLTHKYGRWTVGWVPVGDLVALIGAWDKEGFDVIDGLIARKLGTSVVVTNRTAGAKWRRELGIEIPAVEESR